LKKKIKELHSSFASALSIASMNLAFSASSAKSMVHLCREPDRPELFPIGSEANTQDMQLALPYLKSEGEGAVTPE
jgi:hypothetical protein